jgi:hypothetical protein
MVMGLVVDFLGVNFFGVVKWRFCWGFEENGVLRVVF